MKIQSECKESTTDSRVQVSERGRKATFLNLKNDPFCKIQVDGCVVKHSLAADWVVSKNGVGDIIVELKGKNVEHAVKQVNATATLWTDEKLRVGKLAALIVSTQYPRANTVMQKAQEAFAKKFKAPPHVVTKNNEYSFQKVLSFGSPCGPDSA
jgi:hypothetical protein